MGLDVRPIGPEFVAQGFGVRLDNPLTQAEIDAIHAAMDKYAVLIFPDQPLTDEAHIALTLQLGPLQPAVGNNVIAQADRRLNANFSDVSNLDQSGRIFARNDRGRLFGFGNRLWHTDASFRAVPAKYSLLSARGQPPAQGNTEFADMRAAYDALDNDTKSQLQTLVAQHSLMYSRELLGFTEFSKQEREAFRPVNQSMVRTLPGGGRKSLYLAAHAGAIVGWPRPEARAFIFDLMEHATQPRFVYAHQWRTHDLVIWDNRQTMHRVRRFDDLNAVRDMRRTTIRGDGPTAPQPT
ncbi:MAG: TauD/TfdA family dioxygenase [Gammaproteobacteria bacterium]|nr:TauD/TfdA family dioxygenase [Gammaproteobacteria bacterium]